MDVILSVGEIRVMIAAVPSFSTSWYLTSQSSAFDWNLAASKDMLILRNKLELTRVIDTTAFLRVQETYT